MEPIDPAHGRRRTPPHRRRSCGTAALLIIEVKLHAFLSLVLVSLLTAVVAGIPVADIPTTLLAGFGATLGAVALLVGFGVMLGRLLEVTGGAQVLADTLVNRFGEKRAPFALGVAALIFGFPVFFDAGLVVFLPIIITVARCFGGSVLLHALPTSGAFAAMHAIVPPHPGPVAAADFLGADIGVLLLIGVPVAVDTWFFGSCLVSRVLGNRFHVDVPEMIFGRENGGEDDRDDTADGGVATATGTAPSFGTVLGLLLVPLLLITGNTVVDTLGAAGTIDEEACWVGVLTLLGTTSVALLIALLVAIVVLGRRGRSMAATSRLLDDALAPICSIILITGAGGMFGFVLRTSGIGTALTDSLSGVGLPLILKGFVISTLLRVARGSATVALTTTAGLIAGQAAESGYGDVQLSLIVVAIAAGATVLSHVDDSGFWLVSRFFGMDETTTLKTWTVMETTIGLTACGLASVLWLIA